MGIHITSSLDSVFTPVLVFAGGDEFHAPDISDLFPPMFAFEGTVLGVGRVMMIRLVMYLVLALCLVLYATRAKPVPGRVQTLMEMGFDLCHKNINEEVIGQELGRKYSPIVIAIFFTVLFVNTAGVIPGFSLVGTVKPGFPLLLAVFSQFVFVYAEIRETGLGHFVRSSLFPPRVPQVLYILLTPVELISTFTIRPFALFVRLLTNMTAGHFLLALILSASNYFLFAHLSTLSPPGIPTFAAAFAFALSEILVAFLQAYIFAVLTTIYVDLSVHARQKTQTPRANRSGK